MLKTIKKIRWSLYVLLLIGLPSFSQELIDAVKQRNIEKVKDLLEKNPELVREKDRVHYTPLHWAAMLRNKEIAELLVSKNADINDKSNSQHLTPLQCALTFRYGRDPAVLDFLLDQGAYVECAGDEGVSNLFIASASGYGRLAHLLLDGGVDVNSRNKYGLTALHIAAWTGRPHIVELLIDNGADIDAAALDGRRPITMAGESKKKDAIDLLLSHGADNSPQRFPALKGDYLGLKKPGLKPEIFGLGIVSTEDREHGTLVFSPDGKDLIFTVQYQKPEGGYGMNMLFMHEKDGQWTKPQNPLKETYGESCGSFSADGKRLYFHSNRPLLKNGDLKKDSDIWFIERDEQNWGEPVHLEAPMNSDKMDTEPRLTNSGALYFSSNRDGENTDIYRAAFTNGHFSNPEKIRGFVNTKNYESVCYVAPDETFMLYYYIYPGESFVPGLMMSFRKEDGSWSKPLDLKERLGLKANDLLGASLSPDGKYLFILDDMDIYWVEAKIIENLKPMAGIPEDDRRLYIIGGFKERKIFSEVFSVSVSGLTSGRSAAWSSHQALSKALQGHTAVAINNRLFVMGGLEGFAENRGAIYSNDVFSAEIKDSHLIEWKREKSLPHGLGYHAAVTYKDFIITSGGQTPADISTVYKTRAAENGEINDWETAGHLPRPMRGHASVIVKDRLFVLGGHNDKEFFKNVFSAPVDGDGKIGEWEDTTPLPRPLVHFGAVEHNGRIYIFGGQDTKDVLHPEVYSAEAFGSKLGSWRKETPFPAPQSRMTVNIIDKRIIVTGGGFGWEPPVYSAVLVSEIGENGILGKWRKIGDMPGQRAFHAAVICPENRPLTSLQDKRENHRKNEAREFFTVETGVVY